MQGVRESGVRSLLGANEELRLSMYNAAVARYTQSKKGETRVYPFHQVRLVRLMRYGKNVP